MPLLRFTLYIFTPYRTQFFSRSPATGADDRPQIHDGSPSWERLRAKQLFSIKSGLTTGTSIYSSRQKVRWKDCGRNHPERCVVGNTRALRRPLLGKRCVTRSEERAARNKQERWNSVDRTEHFHWTTHRKCEFRSILFLFQFFRVGIT